MAKFENGKKQIKTNFNKFTETATALAMTVVLLSMLSGAVAIVYCTHHLDNENLRLALLLDASILGSAVIVGITWLIKRKDA